MFCGCQHESQLHCQASIRDCAAGKGSIERILEELGLCTEQNVAKMRVDVFQLEHFHVIISPPLPTQRPDSVVDREGVCTLCWIEPNTDIVTVLGGEWSCMFMYNGILCYLQNCNDSSDRGATRAMLQHL